MEIRNSRPTSETGGTYETRPIKGGEVEAAFGIGEDAQVDALFGDVAHVFIGVVVADADEENEAVADARNFAALDGD